MVLDFRSSLEGVSLRRSTRALALQTSKPNIPRVSLAYRSGNIGTTLRINTTINPTAASFLRVEG